MTTSTKHPLESFAVDSTTTMPPTCYISEEWELENSAHAQQGTNMDVLAQIAVDATTLTPLEINTPPSTPNSNNKRARLCNNTSDTPPASSTACTDIPNSNKTNVQVGLADATLGPTK